MKLTRTLTGAVLLAAPLLVGVATAPSASASSVEAAQSPAAAHAAFSIGYDITIHTANVNYAGTDGDVYLRVNGSLGSTDYIRLDDSNDNYERNRTDHFVRSAAYVGRIVSVTIKFDPLGGANAEWLPDRVTVNGATFLNFDWFLKGAVSYRTLTVRG
jgi:PLAT/LH2 domain